MSLIALLPIARVGDVTAATNSIQSFVTPLLATLAGIAGLVSVLFIIYSRVPPRFVCKYNISPRLWETGNRSLNNVVRAFNLKSNTTHA